MLRVRHAESLSVPLGDFVFSVLDTSGNRYDKAVEETQAGEDCRDCIDGV